MTLYTADDLDMLLEQHFFSDLDYNFAKYLAQIYQTNDNTLIFTLALLSRVLSRGDICIYLPNIAGTTTVLSLESENRLQYPDLETWHQTLSHSSMVSKIPDTPLVMDEDGRLFLARYFDYLQKLVHNISLRCTQIPLFDDKPWAERHACALMDCTDPDNDFQIQAATHAVTSSLTVISGGPGTGKTFLTSRIKQLFNLAFQHHKKKEPVIRYLAPTGKAASRMEQGETIHAALKPLQDHSGFIHHREKPLRADMVIIDEATMIDLVLFHQLLDAVSDNAHVVILGDHNQLASVQAGSIFSEICSCRSLSPVVFHLEKNYRSSGKEGIKKLGKAITESNGKQVEKLLLDTGLEDIEFINFSENLEHDDTFSQHVVHGFNAFQNSKTVEKAVSHIEDFKILCAHNQGRFGTLPINHLCENLLRIKFDSAINTLGFKKIIMVTANDYRNQLFNGDTGVLVENNNQRTAVFDSRDNTVLHLIPDVLQGYETAFAISIHKSQGSEYDTVLILMPEQPSPLLSRQLLYTGVTRARKKVIVAGNMELIKQAVETSVLHTTGLADALDRHLETKNNLTESKQTF